MCWHCVNHMCLLKIVLGLSVCVRLLGKKNHPWERRILKFVRKQLVVFMTPIKLAVANCRAVKVYLSQSILVVKGYSILI